MKQSYKKYSDNELIKKIRSGDDGALDFLLNKYKNMVRGKAKVLFLVGGDRDDLIQEGMIGLYMAIRDYDESKNVPFLNFADVCTTRRIYNAIESSKCNKNKPLNDFVSLSPGAVSENGESEYLVNERADEVNNPESLMLEKEAEETLTEKLKGILSELEMEVLKLYVADNSYENIALRLNKSVKAVDNAVQRIRKKIKKIL